MARKKVGKEVVENPGSGVRVRGFFRLQAVDSKTKKVMYTSDWIENKLTNAGLINLAVLLGSTGGYTVGYAALGTQTAAIDMAQTDISGRTSSFRSLNLSTSGTCTLTCTASFSSAEISAGSCNVGVAGLYKTNTAGSLIAAQIFTASAWATNQDFNLTYQIRFATA